jgi:AcrR family transcriptional regulator
MGRHDRMKKKPARTTNGGRRDPERTRAAILAAAIDEFAAHGLGGARVDRIAARAGANKRMLYYFGDKDGLLLAALEDRYAHIRSADAALDLEHLDPRKALKRLVERSINQSVTNPVMTLPLPSLRCHVADRKLP